jgi:hypothetical protein
MTGSDVLRIDGHLLNIPLRLEECGSHLLANMGDEGVKSMDNVFVVVEIMSALSSEEGVEIYKVQEKVPSLVKVFNHIEVDFDL